MIKAYITQLQCRVQSLNQLMGSPSVYESESKACKQKLEQILAKISTNKEMQRKYQKISNHVQKYHSMLDGMFTPDKVNIILDELDSLVEVGETLNRIQKNLGCVDAEVGATGADDIELVGTMSQLKYDQGLNRIEVVKYDSTRLAKVRQEERQEMNAIMELNYRIVNNLNQKIKQAYAAKIKNGPKV